MKRVKKRLAALVLAGAMVLGLGTSSLAAGTGFSDVPESHWAYQAIMEMANKGVIKGVGEGRFDPEGTVTAEMFIVLVGRVIYPELQPQGSDWSGPYVAKFKENNHLWNTNITDETLKEPITRCDMAQIFSNTTRIIGVEVYTNEAIVYGISVRDEDIDPRALQDLVEKESVEGDIADYSEIPGRYRLAVENTYAMGLMRGDQNGCFNGGSTATRMEVATVISRLMERKEAVAPARKLRTELVAQDLAALLPDDPTEEEVADAVFQVLERWALDWMFSAGGTAAFTEEERETIRASLNIPEETFKNGYEAGRWRRNRVALAEQKVKKLDAQSIGTLSVKELAYAVRDVNALELRDIKALMDKRGLTYEDFEAAYRAADKEAWSLSGSYRSQTLSDTADIAVTAAKLAKIEGRDSFTIHTYGSTVVNPAMTRDHSKLHLGIFGEDGRLVCTPDVNKPGWWEFELTVNTDHLDEEFTVKLIDAYEDADGYYLTQEMIPEILVQPRSMTEMIYGGFTFHLSEAKRH